MLSSGIFDQKRSAKDAAQSRVEELNLQLAMGAGEMKRLVEAEWAQVNSIMERQSRRIRRRSEWADQQLDLIQIKLIALKDVLHPTHINNARKFDMWRSRVAKMIHQIEFLVHEIYGILDEGEQDIMSDLHIHLEVYVTHLSISREFTPELLREEREALVKVLDETMIWRDQEKEQNMMRMQRFRDQVHASFLNLREAFIELTK